MAAAGGSSFREEDCPAHKHVEWDVTLDSLRQCKYILSSPAFKIGKQSYMLMCKYWSSSKVLLHLRWKGPCDAEQSTTGMCWIGVKRKDGTYTHRVEAKNLRPECEREKWTKTDIHFDLDCADLEKWYLTPDGHLTFFFLMNVDRVTAGDEACSHSTPPLPAPPSGSIRKVECSSHTEVEWDVDYQSPSEGVARLTSPVFEIGPQLFFFESCFEYDVFRRGFRYEVVVRLDLYRVGRPFSASARCWAGLKLGDGSYSSEVVSHVADLQDDLRLWTQKLIFQCCTEKDFEKQYLTSDRHLTFFYRLNVGSNCADTCVHGPPPAPEPPFGSIRREECPAHTEIEWDVDYVMPEEEEVWWTSPVFEIGTRAYIFQCSITRSGAVHALTYSLGRPVSATVRLCSGLKFRDGTYPVDMRSVLLDLREDWGFWTCLLTNNYIYESKNIDKLYLTPDRRLRFFFRLNEESTRAEMSVHGISESTKGRKNPS